MRLVLKPLGNFPNGFTRTQEKNLSSTLRWNMQKWRRYYARVLGALLGDIEERHAWHSLLKNKAEQIDHASEEKQWRHHSTRCFQCPPQGVAPCGPLLPFEGTCDYANENTWRSLFMNTDIKRALDTRHKACALQCSSTSMKEYRKKLNSPYDSLISLIL